MIEDWMMTPVGHRKASPFPAAYFAAYFEKVFIAG